MRLGVFGGTFDPPHIGHLVAAQDALSVLHLDRVILVPARVPPHKLHRLITPGDIRLELVRAAVDDDPRFEVDDEELRRPGPSWTIDTLRSLSERRPGSRLFLLLGTDQFRDFTTWRDPDEIRRLAEVAVLSRAGEAPAGEGCISVPVTRIDVTSTDIRQRVAAGRPIRYLVPAAVEALIEQHGLYSGDRPHAAGTGPVSGGYDRS